MSVHTAIEECLDAADDCKTSTGFYVFTNELLKMIIQIAYNQGDMDGGEISTERFAQLCEERIGKQ